MRVLVYSTKPFEKPLLEKANAGAHQITYTEKRLTSETTILASGQDAVSIFSADDASSIVLEKLKDFGVAYITLRSAGHDNINKIEASKLKMKVANVPAYSPNAIAEHAITLLMAYNRKITKAQSQTLHYNFLLDNLIGFNLFRKNVGVLGTGRIGSVLVKILHGFGCNILANDTVSNAQLISSYAMEYVSKATIFKEAEIIFVCLPLTENTHHLMNMEFFQRLKQKPIIINIARGAVVDTQAILMALNNELISGYATDVYEKEHGVFFYDRSQNKPKDPLLHSLLCHPKVLLTPHQAFATNEALKNIAETTITNLNAWADGNDSVNEIS